MSDQGADQSSVTGAIYKKPRVRGLAPWRPHKRNVVLLGKVLAVLEEYADFLPVTVRQVFYRLVGAGDYPKDEHAYGRLLEMMNRARRAGCVPFAAIRDDGATEITPDGFSGKPEFWDNVRAWAAEYRRNLLTGQPYAVELWVEAAGMVPQVVRVADDYGVPVYSSGGFDSVTVRHETARRIMDRSRPTMLLNLGDHDPSGGSIVDSFAADVAAFCRDYGQPGKLEAHRLVVTPEQIERYDLPTSPPKVDPATGRLKDNRGDWTGGTVQVEALSPLDLAAEVRTGLEAVLDLDALERVRHLGDAEREELVATVEDIGLTPPPRTSADGRRHR